MLKLTIHDTRTRPPRVLRTHRTATALLVLALGSSVLTGCSRGADEDDAPAGDGPDATSTPAAGTASPSPDDGETGGEGPDGTDNEGGDGGPGTPVGRTPVDLTPDEVEDVEDGTDDYFDDHTEALERPKKDPKPKDHPHITGDALEDLFNQVAEFERNGWRMAGTPEIVRQRVVRRTSNPDGVVVRACVDNSDVRVVDRNGDEVPNSRASTPRTLNVLTLVPKGDSWVVTDQRLAPKPDC